MDKPFDRQSPLSKPNTTHLHESLLEEGFQERTVNYDEAIKMAGDENKYQKRIGALVALGMFIAGLQVMGFPFVFKQPEAQCLQGNGVWADCTANEHTCAHPIRAKPGSINSIPSTFGLLCEDDRPRILIETLYMVASGLGVVFLGPIGDRFGKRVALLISYLVTCLSLLICPFSPNWIVFIVAVFLSGLGRAPYIYYGFQLLVEVSNEKFRAFGTLIMGVSFAIGAALAGALIQSVDFNWQHFYLFFLSIPSMLGFPLVYFWADESPLSYFPSRQYEKARIAVYNVARVNKRRMPHIRFHEERGLLEEKRNEDIALIQNCDIIAEAKKAKECTMLDLFRYKSLRRAALGGAYICFVTYFIFYGQMLAVDSLSNNPVVVSIITSIVEALACIASVQFITRMNRRTLLMLAFGLTAISFCIFGLVPANDTPYGIYIGYVELSIGRFWIAILMCTTFVYTNELFPTVIRSRGSGLVNFFGRIGSFIPSAAIHLCKEVGICPALIFGLLAVPAIGVSYLMLETKGRALPNHIEEEEVSDEEVKKKNAFLSMQENAKTMIE